MLHAFYQILGYIRISPASFVNTDEIFMELLISIHDNLFLWELIIEVRLLAWFDKQFCGLVVHCTIFDFSRVSWSIELIALIPAFWSTLAFNSASNNFLLVMVVQSIGHLTLERYFLCQIVNIVTLLTQHL